MILVRTTDLAPPVLQLADDLEGASGLPVSMLVDERQGDAGACRYPKLSLTRDSYASLGLYTPADVGWRCGDYGFYLARRTYPDVKHFWMFESDVRLVGESDRFFAATGSRTDLDLLAARLRPAEAGWWWRPHVAAADAQPWRCFFPAVRLSARAIDFLHAKRRQHSRTLSRVTLWPNDESFVATAVAHSDLHYADLNALGARFYDDATFSYDNVIGGETLDMDRSGPPKLLHPVLSGQAYQQKMERVSAFGRPDPWSFRVRRAVARRINARRPW